MLQKYAGDNYDKVCLCIFKPSDIFQLHSALD
jgi:hypothetical protein